MFSSRFKDQIWRKSMRTYSVYPWVYASHVVGYQYFETFEEAIEFAQKVDQERTKARKEKMMTQFKFEVGQNVVVEGKPGVVVDRELNLMGIIEYTVDVSDQEIYLEDDLSER